jgi:ribonuclease HI
MDSLLLIKYHPDKDLTKGKLILDIEEMRFHSHEVQIIVPNPRWLPPPDGWCKLNTDSSLSAEGVAGSGMIVNDSKGETIVSACRQLHYCTNALGAELYAVMEGLSLALHWCSEPLLIETDCLEIVKLLNTKGINRSAYSSIVEEIKTLIKVLRACITHVKRCQNTSSHFLANYARNHACTAVWLASGPEGLASMSY